jgi:iron(III) transport system substrate-binding protein
VRLHVRSGRGDGAGSRSASPSSSAVDSPLNKFRYRLIDPAIALDEWDKWSRLWSALFLGGQEVKKDE